MLSMYPMAMMGLFNMGGMYGMNSMYGMGGNVHQSLKSIYGIGYGDSGATRPYAQPYPMPIVQRSPEAFHNPQRLTKLIDIII